MGEPALAQQVLHFVWKTKLYSPCTKGEESALPWERGANKTQTADSAVSAFVASSVQYRDYKKDVTDWIFERSILQKVAFPLHIPWKKRLIPISNSGASIEAGSGEDGRGYGEDIENDLANHQQPRRGYLRRSGHVGLGRTRDGSVETIISLGSDHEGGGAGEAREEERRSPPRTKWQGGGLVPNGALSRNGIEKPGFSNHGKEIYFGLDDAHDSRKSSASSLSESEARNNTSSKPADHGSNGTTTKQKSGSASSGTHSGKSLLSKRKKFGPRRITIHPAPDSPDSCNFNHTVKTSVGSPRFLTRQRGGGATGDYTINFNRGYSSPIPANSTEALGATQANDSTTDAIDFNNQDIKEIPTITVERNIEGHFVIKETTNHYYTADKGSGDKLNNLSLENGYHKRRNSKSTKSNPSSQNQSLSWVEIQQQRHLNDQQNQQKLQQNRRPNSGLKIHHIVKNGREVYPPGLDSRSATPCYVRDQHSPIWVTRTSLTGALADDEENAQDSEWAERVSLSDASEYQYPEPGRQSPHADPVRAGHGKPSKAAARPRRMGMSRRGRRGCCKVLRLKEDNARFILLAIVMVIYMLSGAAIFSALERDNETEEKEVYRQHIDNFKVKYPLVNETDLRILLRIHSEAETAGYVGDKRPRWDFSGAFYFVGTVVSTIGFGMTTPRTPAGKVILIFYGFFGCAGAILFFNLFLERIITFLAYILRAIHERGERKQGIPGRRRSSQGSEDEQLDSWKPSVYWVMLILLLGALSVALVASGMYHPVEDWTFWDAMYFCFVAFATIGFGDYVVSQKEDYPNIVLYRLGNFVFLVLGSCCVYSLFNVTSIVIKQFLNWMLRKLNCECRIRRPPMTRRNAITPGHLQRGKAKAAASAGAGAAASTSGDPVNKAPMVTVTDADGDSDSEYRRNSGEMISMKDFLQANKISLAMMQKQLWETSQGSFSHNNNSGFQGGVGPLAILNRKLGQDEYDPSM